MKLHVKSAIVIDKNSSHSLRKTDLIINNGIIEQIGENLQAIDAEVFESENLHVSIGWFDIHAYLRDPGFEQKEDLSSGTAAAASGGFTGIACMPLTSPPIHSKAEVEYIKSKSSKYPVDIFPIGCISHNLEGKELSEMYDMHVAGAVAFCDGKKSIENPGLLHRALLYAKNFGGVVFNFPDEKSLSKGGKMNEGIMSTLLGLKGMPALSEEMMISRDLALAEYNDYPLHFTTISSSKSVALIRQAKKNGLKITADVGAHYLALDDSSLSDFDTNFKVKPPFRTKEDVEALIQGLKDGTIDAICSDHNPEEIEEKKKEFDHAAFGIIGFETAYAVSNSILKNHLTVDQIIEKITVNPRNILNLTLPKIEIGEKANLTFFNPDLNWILSDQDIKSKSKNTPYLGKMMLGKALAIFNNNSFITN